MMPNRNSVEKSGKSVQEAVNQALEELGADIDDVDVEVIDEGAKGLFGLGGKEAHVKVSIKNTCGILAGEFIEALLDYMDLNLSIEVSEDDETVEVQLKGPEGGIAIGRRGETLDALQYLTNLAVGRFGGFKRIVIDVEDYRKRRQETLINLANRVAARVMDYRKPIALEPMSAYERRIIHSTLQGNEYITTYSTGEEPNRKVIIALK